MRSDSFDRFIQKRGQKRNWKKSSTGPKLLSTRLITTHTIPWNPLCDRIQIEAQTKNKILSPKSKTGDENLVHETQRRTWHTLTRNLCLLILDIMANKLGHLVT